MTTNDDVGSANDDATQLTTLAAAVEAAQHPIPRLVAVTALSRALDSVQLATVEAARPAASWEAIGAALGGMSKQGAQRRFSRPTPEVPGGAEEKPKPPRRSDLPWEVTTRKGRVLLTLRRRTEPLMRGRLRGVGGLPESGDDSELNFDA